MQPSRTGAALVGLAALAVLAGCNSLGAPMTSPTPSDSGRPPFQTTSPLPGQATPSPGVDTTPSAEQWAAILADLSGRGVAADTVELVSARQVTWNDGSLGCPKPGQSYTQALVPGMQVLVVAGGTHYDYRFGRSATPKLCER